MGTAGSPAPARLRRLRRLRRHVLEALGGLAALILAGVVFQLVGEAVDTARFRPPGSTFDIGGYRLHLQCSGQSSPTTPTVVFDAGLGAFSITWRQLIPPLAAHTRVCAYDRAGLGWSDASPFPRTSRQIAAELHALLERADERPPYVLVGHSFGGHNVRLFAYAYPQAVAGMVLEEVALEDYPAVPDASIRRARWAAQVVGFSRLTADYLVQPLALQVPAAEVPGVRAAFLRSAAATTEYQEFAAFEESAAQVREARRTLAFPEVPVISVSRAGLGPQTRRLREEIAAASPRGRHVIAETTSHNVHIAEPNLVIRLIEEVLGAAVR